MRKAGAARVRRLLAWRGQALFLRCFWLVVGALSPERASAAGSALARVIGPHLRRHRKIRRNLALALPGRRPEEIEALARSVWANFGAVLGEFPHLAAICGDAGAPARVEVIDRTPVESSGPRIFALAHLANWEFVTRIILQRHPYLVVVYSPQENPWVERLVQRKRTLANCEWVPAAGAAQKSAAALAQGRCVALLTDQRADGGRPIEFFGLEAETTDVPARLALACGCQLVPVRVERLGHARFRVTFCEPVEPDHAAAGQKQKALEMTRRLQALFEAWIRERPDQWLCAKRRWKVRKDRPHATTREAQPPVDAAGSPSR